MQKFDQKKIKNCLIQNKNLLKYSLVFGSFGNVSQRLDKKFFTIKPSGVNLEKVNYKDFPIININDGTLVSNKLIPSTDAPTHRAIYKRYSKVGGIAHTHSVYATAWSQSGKYIPILGTTHADYWKNNIPITKDLKKNEIQNNYEYNTGLKIINTLQKVEKDPLKCPGILVKSHGPFVWGKDANDAVLKAHLIENISKIAYITLKINNKSKISKELISKHFLRKQGKKSYYGQ